jgi:hypothetical protein
MVAGYGPVLELNADMGCLKFLSLVLTIIGRTNPERVPRGADHSRGGAKLTESLVRSIRNDYEAERGILAMLSRKYGVDRQTIADVVYRKFWTHVA